MFEKLMKDAQDYADLGRKLADNVAAGRNVMTLEQLEQVKAVLDPLHARNVTLAADLDAALSEAANR